MNEILRVYKWNSEIDKEELVIVRLEDVIKKPSGYRMDFVGLALFNRERRKLGLSEYTYNEETRTFDEK